MKTIHGDPFGLAGAVFDDTERFRFLLWRYDVVAPQRVCLFVMLNPSTADAFKLDPTLQRCDAFRRRWGHDGFEICNLHAMRTPWPIDLSVAMALGKDTVGAGNDDVLRERVANAARIVIAWGNNGPAIGRDRTALEILLASGKRIEMLGQTKQGHPIHPLARGRSRVPDDVELVAYEAGERTREVA